MPAIVGAHSVGDIAHGVGSYEVRSHGVGSYGVCSYGIGSYGVRK